MIAAMFTVIAAWTILFFVLAGLGQSVRRWFGLKLAGFDTWIGAVWMGYAVAIAALELWHLLLPIDWHICLLLGTLGLGGLIWHAAACRRPRLPIGRTLLTLVIFAPMAIWVANRALDAQLDFDTGLYHLSIIRWLNDYPAVPGLGNLHYRLAFNQTFFLFVAALNVSPFFNQGMHIANSFLLVTLALQLTDRLVYSLFFPRQVSPDRLLGMLFLPVVIYRASRQPYSANISSASPDLSVFIFQVVVIVAFIGYLFASDPGEPAENRQRFAVFSCIVLAVVGTTSKLSFAAFGASIVTMILGLWLWQQRQCIASAVRQAALWLLVVGCLIGLPWIAYGILTSGYPLFPSTIGALTVDYRIPADITTDAANWVLAYARNPRGDEAATLRGWDWLKSWWSMMRDSFDQFLFVIPLAASVILLAAYGLLSAILGLIGKSPPRDGWRWLPLLPALVSVVFWFLTAPDPRFAGAAFWILALWTGIMLVSLLRQIRPPAIVVRASIAAPAGVALVLVALGISAGFRLYGNGFPPLPHAPMKTYQTDSGLIVNIPANANNPLQLWDAPLPASPYTLPHLELRGSDLRSGFRMNDP